MKKIVLVFCRSAIILLFIAGLWMCLWICPFLISLGTVGVVSGESSSTIPVTQAQNIAFWTQLIFAWLTALPCFAVLGLALKSTGYIKKDRAFSRKNAIIYKIIALILLMDAVVFIIGNVIFMLLEWNPFALGCFSIGILGIMIALANYAVYLHLAKATDLKEENDSIL